MEPDAEARLLARCLHGEADAWDELFEEFYPPTARFLFQMVPGGPEADVEELCQEVFLSVVRHLASFQGGCRLQTWLCRIAVNKARDFHERQAAAKRGGGRAPISLEAEDPATGLRPDPPASAPGPDAALMAAEEGALLHQAVDRLDDPCREVIQLRYFADLSYEEIALALGLNPKTVSSRLSKCLDRLETLARGLFPGEETPRVPV